MGRRNQPAGLQPRTSCFVLFYPCGGMGNASARTRLYAYLPCLQDLGIRWHIASYHWHKFDRPQAPRRGPVDRLWLELLPLRNLAAFFRADTLFFQKKTIPRFIVWLGKRLGKRIVYDLDDAIYYRPPASNSGLDPHQLEYDEATRDQIIWILTRCSLALVSGEELARFCLQYAPKVRILPSVVDRLAENPALAGEQPVIGWVGAPENQRYLREIDQVLLRLQE